MSKVMPWLESGKFALAATAGNREMLYTASDQLRVTKQPKLFRRMGGVTVMNRLTKTSSELIHVVKNPVTFMEF